MVCGRDTIFDFEKKEVMDEHLAKYTQDQSLASTRYRAISSKKVEEELSRKIKSGFRPRVPECPASIMQIIQQCWHHDPAKRPSFSQLLPTLAACKLPFGSTDMRTFPETKQATDGRQARELLLQ